MATIEEICAALVECQAMTEDEAQKRLSLWREDAHGAKSEYANGDAASPLEKEDAGEEESDRWIDWLNDRGFLTDFQAVALLAGQTGPLTLGPYRMIEQVAAGKLGAVFRAVHSEFNQRVSVKVFPSELNSQEEMIARLGREARISAELDHPHVVRSFEVGMTGDVYYLAIEELIGETLEDRLRREDRLPYEEACRIISCAAKGLAHLHAREVIHRDLRPSNIWLASGNVSQTVVPKLMEFGAAIDALSFLDDLEEDDEHDADGLERTNIEMTLGQYDYLPPEQIYDARCADAVSDIYSLGCTFYHCLTGQPPWVHTNPVKQVLHHVYDEPALVRHFDPNLPAQLDETLKGMLAKDSADRFQTADELAWALQQYLPDQPEGKEHITVDAANQVSQEYLEYVLTKQPAAHANLTEDQVAITPELTRFLDAMAARNSRRKRRRRS